MKFTRAFCYRFNQIQGLALASNFGAAMLFQISKLLARFPRYATVVQDAKDTVGLLYVHDQMWRLDQFIEYWASQDPAKKLVAIPVGFNYGSESEKSNVERLVNTPVLHLSIWRPKDIVWAHNLDKIVFSHPYFFWQASFSLQSLKETLAIYVPYTYGVLNDGPSAHFGRKSITGADVVLCESDEHIDIYKDLAPKQRVIAAGFPGSGTRHYPSQNKTLGARKEMVILVSPHWTSVSSLAAFSQSSIKELLLELVELQERSLLTSRRIKYIWRPHPWFQEFASNPAIWEQIHGLVARLCDPSIGNRRSTSSVSDDFEMSELLVHNSVSFIAEWAFTRKRSIFWTKGSKFISNLNSIGEKFFYCAEHAEDASGFRFAIENILKNKTTPALVNHQALLPWLAQNGDSKFNEVLYGVIEDR